MLSLRVLTGPCVLAIVPILFSFFNIHSFIWLHCVLDVAQRIFNFHCGAQDVFFFLLVVACGISSLTRNRNWAPSIGIEDS